MVRKIVFSLITLLFLPIAATSATYLEIVQRLNSETNLEVRQELVQSIALFPSSGALSFLLQIIELDPNLDVQSKARTVRREMQRFLFQDDTLVISFRHGEKDFSLRKTVFEEKIKEERWKGDAQAFSQFYLLDKILDLEIDTYAGQRVSESMYSSMRAHALPSRSQLDRHIEKSIADLLKRYEEPFFKEALIDKLFLGTNISQAVLDYYGANRVKHYIWRRWVDETREQIKENSYHQAKKEILKYVLEEALKKRGRYRDDFGPRYLRERLPQFYESFKKLYIQFKTDYPDGSVTPQEVAQFLKEYPHMDILLKAPRAKIQAVWFTFPSLAIYQEKDPAHADEAATLIQSFYKEIFSKDFLSVLEEETLSVFDVDPVPALAGKPLDDVLHREENNSHIQKLESDIDQQKRLLAQELKKYPQISKEQVKEVLGSYFAIIQEILSQEKTRAYSPVIGFSNALEEARGRYLSTGGDVMMAALMWFCGGIMNMKMRDQLFSHLEGRKAQFQKVYNSMVSLDSSAQEKTQVFQKVVQEFGSRYPLEFVWIEPDWISRGENFSIPDIEYHSFYGTDRKKPSDQDIYYSWNDPEPSLTLFQWVSIEEEHFFEFLELSSENQSNMMLQLQDQLFLDSSLKEAPLVQSMLFRKYLSEIGLYSTLEADLHEEELEVPKMGTVNLFLELN